TSSLNTHTLHDALPISAIERMEHAHTGGLIGPRAGLYDRADDHFQDPSADGVKYHGDQDSHIRIQKEGKVVKAGKSDDRYQKGRSEEHTSELQSRFDLG